MSIEKQFSFSSAATLLRGNLVLFNVKILFFQDDDPSVDSPFQIDHRLLLFLFEDTRNIGIHVD